MITFTGDLYLGDNVTNFEEEIRNKIIESDYVISNFENVLRNEGGAKRIDKASNLQFTKEGLENYLKKVNTNIVFTLGNNHMHDIGQVGVNETITFLKKYERIKFTGIGIFQDVIEPLVIEDNNKKIAFLCVSTDEPEVMSVLATDETKGVLDYNDCRIVEVIKKYKKIVDFFVIIPHWGREYVDYPSIQQRQKAYKWIDAGADLIVGHHPHIIQGKESYKEKWIYYSLGNYVFPDTYNKNGHKHQWNKDNNMSIALKVSFSSEILIEEFGLFFDTKTNCLRSSNQSLKEFYLKSKKMNIVEFPIKKYFSVWQENLYKRLKIEYSLISRLKRLFPYHKDHTVIGYVIYRFKRKYL